MKLRHRDRFTLEGISCSASLATNDFLSICYESSIRKYSTYSQYFSVMCFNSPFCSSWLPNSAKSLKKIRLAWETLNAENGRNLGVRCSFFPPPLVFASSHPPPKLWLTGVLPRVSISIGYYLSTQEDWQPVRARKAGSQNTGVLTKINARLEAFPQLPHFRFSRVQSYFRVRDTAPLVTKNANLQNVFPGIFFFLFFIYFKSCIV